MCDLEGIGTTDMFRVIYVYYESIKREWKTKPIYECRCDERLKSRVGHVFIMNYVVYYESIKREVKTKPIYECRCDEIMNR